MVLPVEAVVVFEKGGRVLWSRRLGHRKELKGDPINSLIGSVLVEGKGGQELRATIESYAVEWRYANEMDAVVVVAYDKSMELSVGGELLERLRSAATRLRRAQQQAEFEPRSLDKAFDAIAQDVETKHLAETRRRAAAREEVEEDDSPAEEAEPSLSVEERLRRRGVASKGAPRQQRKAGAAESVAARKKPTVWRDAPRKRVSEADAAELDYGRSSAADQEAAYQKAYMPEAGEAAAWEEEEEVETKPGWLGSLVERASGTATMSAEDVAPIMSSLRERLVAKNVAAEIATEICDSVAASLVGTRIERFGRVRTAVAEALSAAVERVLSPKRSTDVLREVLARPSRKPYVIVFVGINGVGKSTTLSKVAYYLKTHGLAVGLAACDTFRSGAVEQLRSHAKCLGVDLFERGYLKDPALVAKAAIDDAVKAKRDVVLVDTAGRMQNNDKLMRELAKLVSLNNPDLVLFVGEALVGNDGVNQITMFNKALMNFADNRRAIDGIILTKFDCIDDKVGAALSVTYKTGQPIVFVGVGQKYIHLKKLSVNHVLNALFH
mmetsp:Transcript_9773/g.31376  ORF Transcript_9773/g.31376 Transcript_9773/m.31376 type:complete len:553 (-) Transcript_9773:883-2541(-)